MSLTCSTIFLYYILVLHIVLVLHQHSEWPCKSGACHFKWAFSVQFKFQVYSVSQFTAFVAFYANPLFRIVYINIDIYHLFIYSLNKCFNPMFHLWYSRDARYGIAEMHVFISSLFVLPWFLSSWPW